MGVIIWIHDSCYSLGTIIQTEKYQQLKFIIFILSFSHLRIYRSKWKKYFSHSERKSVSFMLLINRNLNYTQFNCLNGIKDSSWFFMTVQHAPIWCIKIAQFVHFMHMTFLCRSMIYHFMWYKIFYKSTQCWKLRNCHSNVVFLYYKANFAIFKQ